MGSAKKEKGEPVLRDSGENSDDAVPIKELMIRKEHLNVEGANLHPPMNEWTHRGPLLRPLYTA